MTIVNRKELLKETLQILRATYHLTNEDEQLIRKGKIKELNEYLQTKYKLVRVNVYAKLRKEAKEKANSFWLGELTGAAIKNKLEELGLFVYENNVAFKNGGAEIIIKYLNDVVIPELEKLGIKNVKVTNNASSFARNVLDFTRAEISEDIEKEI